MESLDRVQTLWAVGQSIQSQYDRLTDLIQRSSVQNPWFLPEFYQKALHEFVEGYLSESSLNLISEKYELPTAHDKQLGLIMAGNIPLVGIQDIIHGYLSGFKVKIKLSQKDLFVLPEIIKIWQEVDTDCGIEIVTQLKDYDAVIATGSDNTINQFKHYFKEVPSILRGHRNGVAILTGEESPEALQHLNADVFTYFGLGCRNVSKLYVPEQYDFAPIMDALMPSTIIKNHSKYVNNYEYNYAMLVMNQVPHVTNGHLLMYENESLDSRVSTVHFEYYNSKDHLQSLLSRDKNKIQCILSENDISGWNTLKMGQAQKPSLLDFADQVDTMSTLINWIDG